MLAFYICFLFIFHDSLQYRFYFVLFVNVKIETQRSYLTCPKSQGYMEGRRDLNPRFWDYLCFVFILLGVEDMSVPQCIDIR